MKSVFEELDWQQTPLGEISLRKRSEPRLDHKIIYEVKLGDEFLMSSLFVEAEEQLAALGLAKLKSNGHGAALQVIVGGLGLGYTALSALQDSSVARVRTIDVMGPVIDWHQRGLLPIGDVLATDPRSSLIEGDFFALATDPRSGFCDDDPVHAVLLDIDHSPSHWLKQGNQSFYNATALTAMATKIVSGGVFGLWSNELPDQRFIELLREVFDQVEAEVVRFDNPYSGGESTNSVYLCSAR
ncbi:MAG: spermidine synthase [Gammaproteobacteria bacterium]|nr:spermidine synthase [Gammaproteobacteria bacterium]